MEFPLGRQVVFLMNRHPPVHPPASSERPHRSPRGTVHMSCSESTPSVPTSFFELVPPPFREENFAASGRDVHILTDSQYAHNRSYHGRMTPPPESTAPSYELTSPSPEPTTQSPESTNASPEPRFKITAWRVLNTLIVVGVGTSKAMMTDHAKLSVTGFEIALCVWAVV